VGDFEDRAASPDETFDETTANATTAALGVVFGSLWYGLALFGYVRRGAE
jgi:hypothetical protein